MLVSNQHTESLRLWARAACILEAWARKPGNVHPGRSFADLCFDDFVLSAEIAAGPLSGAPTLPLGETVLRATLATRAQTKTNTNLGIVLLLAPLCAAPRDLLRGAAQSDGRAELRHWLEKHLSELTVEDAELVYRAIRAASPGGLGAATRGDVASGPAGTLIEMMSLAKERDLVALQYANAFKQVIDEGLPVLAASLKARMDLETAIVRVFLELLGKYGDSLIQRKLGAEVSNEAMRRARAILDAGWPKGPESTQRLAQLDQWLRADDNRRNPGACADLVAAVLFLALASGIISPEILEFFSQRPRMQKYKVRVSKDYLGFCSAHFISFEGTQCERLHGHNYRVAAEVEAPLNDDFLVFDFIVLKNLLRDITAELDHRMLVPLKSKALEIKVTDTRVQISYNTKEWIFPREDCALLEIENTTAELLAAWVARRLREAITRSGKNQPSPCRMPEVIRVEVEESPGQCAVYETLG